MILQTAHQNHRYFPVKPYLFAKGSPPRFFVTASRGLEGVLQEEIEELCLIHGLRARVWPGSAGCYVDTSWDVGILLNLASLCASRVLLLLAEDEVHSEQDIAAVVRKIAWDKLFRCEQSFAVKSQVNASFVNHSVFLSQCVKDSICDVFREKTGKRPRVELNSPEVHVFVRLVGEKLSVSLDTTGTPLSHRGYRSSAVEAPLRESLAAALLRITGFNTLARQIWESPKGVFLKRQGTALRDENHDGSISVSHRRIPSEVLLSPYVSTPMCGSGTLVIEAVLALLHWKPNVHRSAFAFMQTQVAEIDGLEAIYLKIKKKVLAFERSLTDLPLCIKRYAKENGIIAQSPLLTPFYATDLSEQALAAARNNAKNAGVDQLISFSVENALDLAPHASRGLLIVNPPYGERLGVEEDLVSLYRSLGDLWKQNYPDWNIWVLSGQATALKAVGLRATRKVSLFNGDLPCKFQQYLLYRKEETRTDV